MSTFKPLLLSLALCASCATTAQDQQARAIAATAAASISAVTTSTAAALIALCKPDDEPCRKAIIALGTLGAGTAPIAPIVAPPSCVPPQTMRPLVAGEVFCKPPAPVPAVAPPPPVAPVPPPPQPSGG